VQPPRQRRCDWAAALADHALLVSGKRPAPVADFVPTTGGSIDFVGRKAGILCRSDTILRKPKLGGAGRPTPPEVRLAPSYYTVNLLRHNVSRIGFALAACGVGTISATKREYHHPARVTMGRVIGRAVALLRDVPAVA